MRTTLKIDNLSVQIGGRTILKNIYLMFRVGETHAIMGRNGSGKSSLAKVLAGHPAFTITEGSITLIKGDDTFDWMELSIEDRSNMGLFLAPQYPTEIPGLTWRSFLRTALNAHRKYRNQEELDVYDFTELLEKKAQALHYNPEFLDRSVNVGFSGGEKKRGEILQISLLEPIFSFLDEIDSGLDIDALNLVLNQVQSLKTPENAWIFITHYANVIDKIRPDWVHVLNEGKLVLSTKDTSLTQKIQHEGFEFLLSGDNAQ